jgi:hypothetical protein
MKCITIQKKEKRTREEKVLGGDSARQGRWAVAASTGTELFD